jgi:general secretion pathway protein A
MYASYFGLKDNPFSITPDPSYLYLSSVHQEALAHLLYGTGENGGFVQLTGEVGTGKTTLIRTLLEQRIDNLDVALCLNPKLTVNEFVASICDELHIEYPRGSTTLKPLIDALNAHLLQTHAQGRRTVLIIDEAQNLSYEVLEQIRLLTNLETHRHKLLRIILVGQPELQRLLERQDLRQLAQRITARYHLVPLSGKDTVAYIKHRLNVGGGRGDLFNRRALRLAHHLSSGIPRLINIVCDRALLGAYVRGLERVDASTLRHAAQEALQGPHRGRRGFSRLMALPAGLLMLAATVLMSVILTQSGTPSLLKHLSSDTESSTASNTVQTESEPTTTAGATSPEATTDPTVLTERITTNADQKLTSSQTTPAAPMTARESQPAPIDMLARWLSDTPATDAAMRDLFRLWGHHQALAAETPSCPAPDNSDLHCLEGQGDWDELRRYNRPAILYLRANGAPHPVLLRSLTDQTANLSIEGASLEIDLADLDSLWQGRYLMLWRLLTSHTLIGSGSTGEPVQWLHERLALAEGQPAGTTPPQRFDSLLQARVRRFQVANALEADGVVGARTMVLLNNLAPAADTPMLLTPALSQVP